MTQEPDGPEHRANRVSELQEELRQLTAAVTSQALAEQAIGIMAAMGRIRPGQGWAVLREVSQRTNIALRQVAELILLWGRTGRISPQIADEVEAALDRHGPIAIDTLGNALGPTEEDPEDPRPMAARPLTLPSRRKEAAIGISR
ncbi:ANTAR domain-containing protein [Streptomyces sp. NPDC093094]|uniref:ANTAR domain-containing protein n=1 Tax=Streptomyces sp. NPDC093094 TaxID=3366026 RepID=UPI0037FB4ECC